jgi:hypothetical protein
MWETIAPILHIPAYRNVQAHVNEKIPRLDFVCGCKWEAKVQYMIRYGNSPRHNKSGDYIP